MRIVLPQESFLLQFVWGHTTTLLDYKKRKEQLDSAKDQKTEILVLEKDLSKRSIAHQKLKWRPDFRHQNTAPPQGQNIVQYWQDWKEQ